MQEYFQIIKQSHCNFCKFITFLKSFLAIKDLINFIFMV